MTSLPSRNFKAAALAALLVLLASAFDVAGATLPVARFLSIKPAATWVGIARVHLEVSDLEQAGELLEGSYRIRVPLAPSQNDNGRVKLHAPGLLGQVGDLGRLSDNEATVFGNALSSSGQVHDVVARIRPNGIVRIDVITPARTLRFKSTFASH